NTDKPTSSAIVWTYTDVEGTHQSWNINVQATARLLSCSTSFKQFKIVLLHECLLLVKVFLQHLLLFSILVLLLFHLLYLELLPHSAKNYRCEAQ
ncbi:hypothetical protein GBAR_LOCUS13175, partial [Geodia barretti]